MVGRGHAGAGGLETSLGDQRGRGTGGGAGEHLDGEEWRLRDGRCGSERKRNGEEKEDSKKRKDQKPIKHNQEIQDIE